MIFFFNYIKSQSQSQSTQQHTQQSQRYTRTDSNFIGEIPKRDGNWIKFNITLMVNEWLQQQQRHQSIDEKSSAATTDVVQEVVIKTLEPWMRQLLVLDTDSKNVSKKNGKNIYFLYIFNEPINGEIIYFGLKLHPSIKVVKMHNKQVVNQKKILKIIIFSVLLLFLFLIINAATIY